MSLALYRTRVRSSDLLGIGPALSISPSVHGKQVCAEHEESTPKQHQEHIGSMLHQAVGAHNDSTKSKECGGSVFSPTSCVLNIRRSGHKRFVCGNARFVVPATRQAEAKINSASCAKTLSAGAADPDSLAT
jgi:hypothetical protein